LLVDPLADLAWVEANELAHLDERDPSLGNQTPDEASGDTELIGDFVDIEESN
jgi:hypothetical protein